MQFSIPAVNISKLTREIEKLNGKAEKLGTDPIVFQVLGIEYRKSEDGYSREYYTVEVAGVAPKLNGWELIAVIQHELNEQTLENTNIIRRLPFATVETPEYFRTADSLNCDQCHTRRQRTDTYIVSNGAEFKQVGSTCLKDFTGHHNPESVAAWLESISDLIDESQDEEFGGNGSSQRYSPTLTIVAQAVAMVATFGWKPASKYQNGDSTKEDILNNIFNAGKKDKYGADKAIKITEEHINRAKFVIAGITQLDGKSEYEFNLKVAAQNEWTNTRNIGLLASSVALIERIEAKKKENANSTYQGTIGDKITVKVNVIRAFEQNNPYNRFEPSVIYTLKDENGNLYTWFSSKPTLENGETYTIKGTIKAHEEYKGIKKTVLTRCKVQ